MLLQRLCLDSQAYLSSLHYPGFLLRFEEGRLGETQDNQMVLPSYIKISETVSHRWNQRALEWYWMAYFPDSIG